MHACRHTCRHADIQSYRYTDIQTDKHTHTHSYIYIYSIHLQTLTTTHPHRDTRSCTHRYNYMNRYVHAHSIHALQIRSCTRNCKSMPIPSSSTYFLNICVDIDTTYPKSPYYLCSFLYTCPNGQLLLKYEYMTRIRYWHNYMYIATRETWHQTRICMMSMVISGS